MTPRRIGFFVATTAAAMMILASAAFACVTAQGPYVNDLFAQRAPVGDLVTVRGGNWAAARPVQIGWGTTASAPDNSLGAAVVDSTGTFSAEVKVPPSPAGFYYISVSQDSTTRATPLQVTVDGRALVGPADVSTGSSASGQIWTGLRASQPRLGLTDVAHRAGGSSFPTGPVLAVTAVGLVVIGGLFLAEPRRRLVRARAWADSTVGRLHDQG